MIKNSKIVNAMAALFSVILSNAHAMGVQPMPRPPRRADVASPLALMEPTVAQISDAKALTIALKDKISAEESTRKSGSDQLAIEIIEYTGTESICRCVSAIDRERLREVASKISSDSRVAVAEATKSVVAILKNNKQHLNWLMNNYTFLNAAYMRPMPI
jgi:hypothetical protein